MEVLVVIYMLVEQQVDMEMSNEDSEVTKGVSKVLQKSHGMLELM